MDQNIQYIISQTGTTEDKAQQSYEVYKDVVNAIVRILDPNNDTFKNNNVKKVNVLNDHQQKIAELRDILDSKDKLFVGFQKQLKKSEDSKQEDSSNIDTHNKSETINSSEIINL